MSVPQGANASFFSQPLRFPFEAEQKPRGMTLWDFQPVVTRKPPQPVGLVAFEDHALFRRARLLLQEDLDCLKKVYGFPADDSVSVFLTHHPFVRAVLHEALPHLKEFFGPENIFNLELSREEDGSQTLYAIAVWHNSVKSAAQALAVFEENWWLDHMTSGNAELAFTYEIA
jgi:hypothetical protein